MSVTVVTFDPKYRDDFARLNYAWISTLFEVEPVDRKVLESPERELLADGGQVFFALKRGKVVGTVALKREDDSTFELTKMAVDETERGNGYGKLLLRAALDYAHQHGAARVVLSTHTSLTPAIAMYRAEGFVDATPRCSCYSRCNLYLEKQLTQSASNAA